MSKTRIVAWIDADQSEFGMVTPVKVRLANKQWVEGQVCETCPQDLARQQAETDGRLRRIADGLVALLEHREKRSRAEE